MCGMLQLADAEVPGGGISASMTHGHVSSGSPSTRLLCLRDRRRSLHDTMGLPSCHILRSKSPSYSGVDLHAVRLHGEGADRTTWPRRHLHGCLSLTKRSKPVAEKSPHNFHTRQSPLQQSLEDLQQGLQPVEVSLSQTILSWDGGQDDNP
jgi:hypothetical protein